MKLLLTNVATTTRPRELKRWVALTLTQGTILKFQET